MRRSYRILTAKTGREGGGIEVDCRVIRKLEERNTIDPQATEWNHTNTRNLLARIESIKNLFSGEGSGIITLQSPNGTIIFSRKFNSGEMRAFHDPVMDKIVELVLQAVSSENTLYPRSFPQRLFLAGGLGQSPYLLKQLEKAMKRFFPVEHPLVYREHMVATGATIRGLECAALTSRLCSKFYGLETIVDDPGSMDTVQYTPYWVLRNGDRFKANQEGYFSIVVLHEKRDSRVKGSKSLKVHMKTNPPGVVSSPSLLSCC
ncbi:hypothetical protein BO71DRAFT_33778 [Aspergillus ellipticus CBS 707.79]|uniref:Actin-like ATPase domain-containing protein n=1 Tax=Aspergillus ellipticus CBS 707.79 TaxID=1448320 RepID=A0A319DMC9_9EURO|nr:hypothetical protein BO71DRAFT_33778 [Aspergillus ellipticus CBS 707.79]